MSSELDGKWKKNSNQETKQMGEDKITQNCKEKSSVIERVGMVDQI